MWSLKPGIDPKWSSKCIEMLQSAGEMAEAGASQELLDTIHSEHCVIIVAGLR